jgi:hypothetical protein
MKVRYLPDRDFPPYIFIPGQNPHPKKEGGHMQGLGDPVVPLIDETRPELSHALRYALDLYNYGYFWESHVYFEALWNAHGRQGAVSDFLKAMIKLGAAGVKFYIHQDVSAQGHKSRAIELLKTVLDREGEVFLGFEIKQLIDGIRTARTLPEIYPSWI